MSLASEVIGRLSAQEALARMKFFGYRASLDGGNFPAVLVWVNEITRPPGQDRTRVQVDLRVQVVVGHEDHAKADVPLDEALDDVLDAIAAAGDWLDWTRVERVIRDDEFHAYTIHCTNLATIGA